MLEVTPDELRRPVFGNVLSRIPTCRAAENSRPPTKLQGDATSLGVGTCGRAVMLFSPFASPPKNGSKERIASTLQLTTCSIQRMCAIGSQPLAARSSRSISALTENGLVLVRITHRIGRPRLVSLVMLSVNCTIGTYIIGSGFRFSPASRTSPTTPTIWRVQSSNGGPMLAFCLCEGGFRPLWKSSA